MINKKFFDRLRPHFSTKPTFVDVGANRGQTIDLMRLCNPQKIYAFEPNPHLVKSMRETYANKKEVQIYNCGVGLTSKTPLPFYITEHPGNSSFYKPLKDKIIEIKEIETVALDDVIYSFRGKKIDWLKVDTQGNDHNVLLGATRLLSHHTFEFITVEVMCRKIYDTPYKIDDLTRIVTTLSMCNYSIYELSNVNTTLNGLSHFDATFRRNH